MTSVKELLDIGVTSVQLKILVFGPEIAPLSADPRRKKVQLKRIEIREKLEEEGHIVKYAEDLVNTKIEGALGNPFFQEIVIMEDYDVIVTIVESPGSNVEAGVIASRPNFAAKSSLFIDEEYNTGLAAKACEAAQHLGADYNTYEFPKDIDECNLLGFVRKKVELVQLVKFLK